MAFLQRVEAEGAAVLFSAVTEAELYSHPALTEAEAAVIAATLASGELIPVHSEVARKAGQLRRETRRAGRHTPRLPDALVAASALLAGAVLVTHNTADFKAIPGLAVLDPIRHDEVKP